MLWRRIPHGGSGSGFTVSPTLHALFNGQNGDGVYAIGEATKVGSSPWTEEASPVIEKSGAGWVSEHVKDPCWLDSLTVYVSGHDGSKYQIGRMTRATTASAWAYDSTSSPTIAVGSGGSFDDAGVNFPTILHEPSDTGKEYKCWYGANDGSTLSIGYAHSTNGTSWTKVGQVLTKGSSGQWDDEGILPMAIVKVGSTYNLFFGGYQDPTVPKWQGGIATFTDPEGVYTKSGSNPVLLARFNDSGVFQTPTGATAGATSIGMASSAAFNVGEPVVLADGDSETETQRIATIPDGTHVTLETGLTGAFTSGTPAFRPFASVSVLPRTVRNYAGGYEMFGTPFQPVEDLTVGGSKLREGSFRWTASALTGPWAYDYTTGLLFPLYPAHTGWHKFSAENPSVLAF